MSCLSLAHASGPDDRDSLVHFRVDLSCDDTTTILYYRCIDCPLAYRPQFMILLAPICLMKAALVCAYRIVSMLFALFVAGAMGLSLDSYTRYFALIQEITDLLAP